MSLGDDGASTRALAGSILHYKMENTSVNSYRTGSLSIYPGLGSRGVFGSLEPEPFEKKLGAGAGAAWKKSRELEPLKNYSFTLLVSREKNILPNLTNSQEPEPVFFGPLEPEPLERKNTRSRSRGLLGKKIRSLSIYLSIHLF